VVNYHPVNRLGNPVSSLLEEIHGMKEIIYEQGSAEYEKSRVRFFNNAVPDRYPYQIIHPRSTEEVAAAVKHAVSLDKHISVRSGGHLFPHQHLQNDEILIDLKGVNNHFEFDEHTRQISFGPGLTAKDAQDFLNPRNLFFPFGHSPTVGLGGFLLAGGQGWFFPGWGLTSDRWITQLEIVTANGEIKICNRYENADIFWAARGAGMGFFAIVTRFWGHTAPAKKLYMLQWVFSGSKYHSALNWLLDSGKLLKPYHTEMTVSSQYEDAFTDLDGSDEIRPKEILLNGLVIIYADSLEEAQAMSFPFGECPEEHVAHIPLRETTWDEQNMLQEMLMPPNKGLRYKCDSMLTGPEVPREEVSPLRIDLTAVIGCNLSTVHAITQSPFMRCHCQLRHHDWKSSILAADRFIHRKLPRLEGCQRRLDDETMVDKGVRKSANC